MIQTRLGRLVLLAAVCGLAAPQTLTAQRRQRDRISREEIMASPFVDSDLYQVIRQARPTFLEPPKGVRASGPGADPLAPIQVFIDERTQLELNGLRTLSPRTFEEVRYLSPSESVSRFGPKVNGGALLLKTYKPSPRDTTSGSPR